LQGGYGLGLDFHFRYTKFCINSYALRFIQGSPSSLTSSESASVEQCMQYALKILEWTMELSPMAKDALRYMSDFGFVMITFGALFVVQVCQRVQSVSAELETALGRVSALSELMMDLAVGSGHFTAQLCRSLQLHVAQVRQQRSSDAQNASTQNSPLGCHGPSEPLSQGTNAGYITNPDQYEEHVLVDGFLNESALWDPAAWLTEFLTDAGDWAFS
jgi:hypothetical protein